MIVRAIEFRIWEHRFCHAKGRPFRTFIEYLTHHEPDGAQVELERVEQLISHDPKALTAWRQEATRPANRPTREISHDNVMTSRQGNSLGYTLARLARVDPGLHADVCAGKLSANAAAIKAGIRKKLSAFEIAEKIVLKLTNEEWDRLCQLRARMK